MTVIVLSGPIGAGKSTLTTMLSKELGSRAFYESVENNPVLPLFYENPTKYAFLLQIYFLNTRFHNIKDALSADNNVLDRSIYEDELFFQMNADLGRANQTEVDIYRDLLANMMQEMQGLPKKVPDLLVHIDVSYETMLKRITMRGRSFEQLSYDPSLETYYKTLLEYYNPWYDKYAYSPKIRIDGDKYDFVGNPADKEIVIGQIKTKLQDLGQL